MFGKYQIKYFKRGEINLRPIKFLDGSVQWMELDLQLGDAQSNCFDLSTPFSYTHNHLAAIETLPLSISIVI